MKYFNYLKNMTNYLLIRKSDLIKVFLAQIELFIPINFLSSSE